MSAPSSSAASTTTSIGIAGSQRSGQAAATAGRNANRGMFRKASKPLLAFLTIILPLLLWWSSDDVQKDFASKAVEKAAIAPKYPSKSEPVVTEGTAAWENATNDGSLPVNVWSAVTKVGVGCSVKFVFADGYRVQYRFYSKDWNDYSAGTSPNASELRFMVTKEGVTAFPYSVKCS